jgi:hypothetical protein
MLILFPGDASRPDSVDSEFTGEWLAAQEAGFETALFSYRAIRTGNLAESVMNISRGRRHAILRSWMLSGEQYAGLYRTLADLQIDLITSPEAYEEAHCLPKAYDHIAADTAHTEWIDGDNVEAWQLYQSFQQRDAMIKDWVKSAKRRWQDGCFLPAQTSRERFAEIFAVFRQQRGTLFNRGVVIREFMPVITHGYDMRGLPIAEETRLYFWKGELVVDATNRTPSPMDELPKWIAIAKRFASPFITIDIALLTDYRWKIVEVGDGGVSGLPMGLTPERFFRALRTKTDG